ncbi:MAG: DUF4197 domain-containing protein, partial [Alphaproteobacteria bacterium]
VESGGGVAALTDGEIGEGLLEALRVGTERVTNTLGALDGFNGDAEVHIPLPDTLQTVQKALSRVGLSGVADDLELRMNRAAEAAVPAAKEMFWQTISEMNLEDVRGILNGPNDSATKFFQSKMTGPLTERFAPIVEDQLAQAGAVQAFDGMMGDYKAIPFVPDVKADLTSHVVAKALDGLFLLLGREEAAIRENPVKRTTDILKKVFGGVV